ncbi:hypothetical protein [Amycolatopsis sacchari]
MNRQRGYVRNLVTPETWTADYRVVDRVSQPQASVRVVAGFELEAGRRGV